MRKGCTVCALPVEKLKAANELIATGASSRDVERQFGVGRGPALRHKAQCLGIMRCFRGSKIPESVRQKSVPKSVPDQQGPAKLGNSEISKI